MRYLEVCVTKTCNKFSVQPSSKPSSLSTPWLSRFSCHNPAVHSSWPVARMRDRLALCSSMSIQADEAREFSARAAKQHLSRRALRSIGNLVHENANRKGWSLALRCSRLCF